MGAVLRICVEVAIARRCNILLDCPAARAWAPRFKPKSDEAKRHDRPRKGQKVPTNASPNFHSFKPVSSSAVSIGCKRLNSITIGRRRWPCMLLLSSSHEYLPDSM